MPNRTNCIRLVSVMLGSCGPPVGHRETRASLIVWASVLLLTCHLQIPDRETCCRGPKALEVCIALVEPKPPLDAYSSPTVREAMAEEIHLHLQARPVPRSIYPRIGCSARVPLRMFQCAGSLRDVSFVRRRLLIHKACLPKTIVGPSAFRCIFASHCLSDLFTCDAESMSLLFLVMDAGGGGASHLVLDLEETPETTT
jgi:hypothetical protein